jgi:hypothetical protein
MKTSMQKSLDEMTASAVLAMAFDEMEFLGLIKWKPDADKKPATDRAQQQSLDDQVRQLLEKAQAKAALEQPVNTAKYHNLWSQTHSRAV